MTDAAVSAVSRILVATDRSETASRAVAWAADMAARYEAELFVLQVIVPGADPGAQESAQVAYATKDLELYAEQLAGSRGRARVVVDEDPSAAIVETADEEGADVVVVGNAGMSGRKEFLLGNVPNRVSHNARCTVIIVNSTIAPDESSPGKLGRLFRRGT
jgi:nucleotide-binding universal stress UspA family protein